MGLEKIEGYVYDVLMNHAPARDNNDALYGYVLEDYGRRLNIDFNKVSVTSFFKARKRNNIPAYESVTRIRRKLQKNHPELRGSDWISDKRHELEAEFKDYARRS